MKKTYRMTKEGVAELKIELEDLMSQRKAVSDRIKTAREFGDLAENAEYSIARQDQERHENRIGEIDNILKNLELIVVPKNNTIVRLGSSVKLKTESGGNKEFQVVGTVEADPLNGKISDESPIGKILIGKKEGEDVEISTPAETTTYKIVSIS
ncbi:MAG: transcription elongation factor GreA [Candidatus Saccharibacteria bacterium]|jgi:transcription elongation factor GreA